MFKWQEILGHSHPRKTRAYRKRNVQYWETDFKGKRARLRSQLCSSHKSQNMVSESQTIVQDMSVPELKQAIK